MSAAPIRGIGAITFLNLRCIAILGVVNLTVFVVVTAAIGGDTDGWLAGTAIGFAAGFLPFAVLVACIPVAVIGVPAGLLTGCGLRRAHQEWVHVLVFAVVGAGLSVAIMMALGAGIDAAWWASLEGALGAGGARWWSGATYRRTRRSGAGGTTDEQVEDAAVDAQVQA